ncbi:DNA-directed DNA polymerase eta rad30 [Dinochytrium kinnereticum]|nr:DNA-directed DNA polymerase eta rad30 [Dinochytrium kinnereticum]
MRSVIIHVDLDAFYAQVEHVRLGISQDIPLAVQQWQGLIAVNYAARAKGVKRHSSPEEARALAPDIQFVHVATFGPDGSEPMYHADPKVSTHKVSLDVYRKASIKVMEIMKRFAPKMQRASIDEAYMDVTDEVARRILELNLKKDEEPSINWDGAGSVYGELKDNMSSGWRHEMTYVYLIMTGIAHNKTIAKLCSAMNKPNKQTILRESHVLDFMKDLPFSKIRNLGGKLGVEIEEKLGVEKAGEIWPFSSDFLKAEFGEETGKWIYNISRGICDDPVSGLSELDHSMQKISSFFLPKVQNTDTALVTTETYFKDEATIDMAASSETYDKGMFCEECKLDLSESSQTLEEHRDFHFALDLQKEEKKALRDNMFDRGGDARQKVKKPGLKQRPSLSLQFSARSPLCREQQHTKHGLVVLSSNPLTNIIEATTVVIHSLAKRDWPSYRPISDILRYYRQRSSLLLEQILELLRFFEMAATFMTSYRNHFAVPQSLASAIPASIDPTLSAVLGQRSQAVRPQVASISSLTPSEDVMYSASVMAVPHRPSHVLTHEQQHHHQQSHTKLKGIHQGTNLNTSRPGYHQPTLPPTAYDPRRGNSAYSLMPSQMQSFAPANLIPNSSLPSLYSQPAKLPANSFRYTSSQMQAHQSDYSLLEAFEDTAESSEADEYGHEIMEFMRSMESITLPDPHYMDTQSDISWRLRKTLILWLVEIHGEYDLRPETLYLAVNFVDRLCSKKFVSRANYQLLGITALWVAAKYEENHGKVPTLKNLIYICCNSYTERDYIAMEQELLSHLGFVLGHPTAESFLKSEFKFSKEVAPESRAISRYIMELTLVHRRFLNYRPSQVAKACFYVSEWLISGRRFGPQLDQNLEKCIFDVLDSLRHNPPKPMATKFASSKFLKASHLLRSLLDMHSDRTVDELVSYIFGHPPYPGGLAHLYHQELPSGLLTPPKEIPNVRWIAGVEADKNSSHSFNYRSWNSEVSYAL